MPSNLFAQLQMMRLAEQDSIAESRLKLDRIVELYQSRPEHMDYLKVYSVHRYNLDLQTLHNHGVFCVDIHDSVTFLPEELQHDSLGFVSNGHLVYAGRVVFPVKDVRGHVMGWCAYDPVDLPKYLDSRNYGYSAKNATFFGMEKLPEYYTSTEPVIIVEGIVCCIWLRSQGFQALASLGSNLTPYMIQVLSRFGRRCVVIPDSDEAGNKYRAQVKRSLPIAKCIQSCVAKDIDDSRKVYPELAKELHKAITPFGRSAIFQ